MSYFPSGHYTGRRAVGTFARPFGTVQRDDGVEVSGVREYGEYGSRPFAFLDFQGSSHTLLDLFDTLPATRATLVFIFACQMGLLTTGALLL